MSVISTSLCYDASHVVFPYKAKLLYHESGGSDIVNGLIISNDSVRGTQQLSYTLWKTKELLNELSSAGIRRHTKAVWTNSYMNFLSF